MVTSDPPTFHPCPTASVDTLGVNDVQRRTHVYELLYARYSCSRLCGVGGATCRQQSQVNAAAPLWLQIISTSCDNMLFLWMNEGDG